MVYRFFSCMCCLAVAGCATYRPLPLGAVPELPGGLAQVQVDTRSLPFPVLAAHPFDPRDGLDEIEVATLAVVNNPDLRLARDDLAVSRAQAFAAGLLPDPQLALAGDLSNSDAGPGATRAFSFGLSYDVGALISHAAGRRAAQADVQKTDLALLWQEWQVASQARLAFVRLTYGRRLLAVLDANRRLFADRAARTGQAQRRGLLTGDAVLPNLTALQDINKQMYDLQRQLSQTAHDLNTLLGLDARVDLRLQDGAPAAFADEGAADGALAELPRRRPDLRALVAGYTAQDQRYRAALLAQFPALNVGLTRSRDNSNVYSNSLGITLSLPLLNRNRGNIVIEQATRQKLHDEYQVRVQAARNDIRAILDQQRLDREQLGSIETALDQLEPAIQRSDLAARSELIDALAYANARAALLAKQAERINLLQQIAEQRVALQTLLGIAPDASSSGHQQQ
ncbi:TolC family protein [Massilia sp. TW-1]|uniref:TolC family protein n=1 Tax=Telluria antibiotica TaxID=2717319 RepID=A0ABX0P6F3_9BURK|nr:TolC family protein [Telluria antibiotica]NIA52427.1 TolC family protein [Telluria antibiotica]